MQDVYLYVFVSMLQSNALYYDMFFKNKIKNSGEKKSNWQPKNPTSTSYQIFLKRPERKLLLIPGYFLAKADKQQSLFGQELLGFTHELSHLQ